VKAIEAACAGTKVRVHLLGDFYPAGDEYDLVYSVTGRLIPPAGIPINVGVVVTNVETLVNIANAADGKPVTHKTLTVAERCGIRSRSRCRSASASATASRRPAGPRPTIRFCALAG